MAQEVGESLRNHVEALAAAFSGTIGLFAKDLRTGISVAFNDDEVFETASCIKILIMVEAFHEAARGTLSLSESLTFQANQRVMGSGVLRDLSVGLHLRMLDVITLMVVVSDNVATNMMIDRLGVDRINHAAARLGLSNTKLMGRIDFNVDQGTQGLGRSTPRELAVLMERLYRGRAVGPREDRQMVDLLLRQQYNTALTRDLSYPLLVPPEGAPHHSVVQIASKSGSWEGVRNDVGLVLTPRVDYVISLMSRDCQDLRFHVDNEAMRLLPKLSRAVFDRFHGTYSP